MLVAFWALNNLTAHRLFNANRRVLSDHYRRQITNDFEKLLEQEDAKNILKVATPILPMIDMHIRPTSLLEVGPPHVKYDSKKRVRKEYVGADWSDNGKIKETMAADENEDNDKEDPWEKKRQLKKKKQRLKQAAARARAR